MPAPHPTLNGLILYVPGQSEIYWIDNGYARHIPDEATYHGVFGGSPIKEPYPELLELVSLGTPIADGTKLIRAGDDAEIYFLENEIKRWIPTEEIKAAFQLNGNVHSLSFVTVSGFADGPAFVEPDRRGPVGGDDDDDDDDDDDGGEGYKQPGKARSV